MGGGCGCGGDGIVATGEGAVMGMVMLVGSGVVVGGCTSRN